VVTNHFQIVGGTRAGKTDSDRAGFTNRGIEQLSAAGNFRLEFVYYRNLADMVVADGGLIQPQSTLGHKRVQIGA